MDNRNYPSTRKHLGYHKSTTILVRGKKVRVDIDIQPIVKFLDSFPPITMISSCQGDQSGQSVRKIRGGHQYTRPSYVMFHCSDQSVLGKIIKTCDNFYEIGTVQTHVGWFENKLVYMIMFQSIAIVNEFMEILQTELSHSSLGSAIKNDLLLKMEKKKNAQESK